MAVTEGKVFLLKTRDDGTVYVTVGPDASSTELLFLQFKSTDSLSELTLKKTLVNMLAKCQVIGMKVQVVHPDTSAEITSMTVGAFEISPLGRAVHGDFYTVSSSNIPDDAELVFDSDTATVTVIPDFVRPHFLFIAQLPSSIPSGLNQIRIESASWTSDWFPILVSSTGLQTVRTLYSGKPKEDPYTIVLAANGAVETSAGGSFYSDPILTSRADYHDAVGEILLNLFTLPCDLLRLGNRDAQYRIVSVFDPTLTAIDDNSLCREYPPNIMGTRRDKLNGFTNRYAEDGDILMVVHGVATYDRASAWYTTDDNAAGTTSYTYDGITHQHGHYASIPGSAALYSQFNTTGLTPLHEFGHAASDWNNGRVYDLYHDGLSGFMVNKKSRASASDPIPPDFADYNGTTYASDPSRDTLGYPATWTSYHPELIDPMCPNLMDNYWLCANPQNCRLDQLTYDWYDDRLQAKLNR